MCRLLTEAHLSNRGREPKASKEMLRNHGSGLIALSGCGKGEIGTLLSKGKRDEAKEAAYFCREVFDKDFFIELTRYPSREGFTDSRLLVSFATEENLPVVATNNVHYSELNGYRIKELLNAIDQNIPVSQLNGLRTVEQYLKPEKQMLRLFRDLPAAICNTEEIASRCNLELELGKARFPKFDTPEHETDYSYLSKLAYTRATALFKSLSRDEAPSRKLYWEWT